jgi:hypothetical protein
LLERNLLVQRLQTTHISPAKIRVAETGIHQSRAQKITSLQVDPPPKSTQ